MTARPFEVHLRDYVRVVVKHSWIVGLAIAVVCATVWLTSREQPVLFRTEGLIELRGVQPSTLEREENLASAFEQAREFRTLLELIRSNQLTERVAAGLGPEALAELGGAEPLRAAGGLRGRLEVNQKPGTNLVTVGIIGSDARALQEIVNAHMEGFRVWNEERLRGKVGKILDQLEVERPRVEETVAEAQQRVYRFRDEHPEANFDNPDLSQGELLRDIEKKLVDLKVRHLELEGVAERLRGATTDEERRAIPDIKRDAVLKDFEAQERSIKKRLLEMLQSGRGEGHEEVKQAKAELEANLEAQEEHVLGLAESIVYEFDDLGQRIGRLQAMVEEKRSEWYQYNRTLNGFKNLSEELDARKAVLAQHMADISRARQETQTQFETIKVIDEAKVPTVPIPTGVGIGYMFGALIGLAIGVGLSFFLEYLDDTVRTREDVERYMETPLLGHIPFIEGDRDQPESKDTITHRQTKSTVSEAYRTVRTSLIFSVAESGGRPGPLALVVTSAGPREGKTTNAVNLAITMAHSGSRVLLIDADLRRPRIHQSFGIDHDLGLTNFLAGADDFASVVRRSNIENLDVVTSGPLPPNPYELLGSPRMAEFLARAKERYDVVLVDTPPLGAVSDACLLGGVADGVVQIVSAARTRRRIARLGKEQLDKVGAKVVGVILNCAAPVKSSYDYYYYYDSGYYHYYQYYGDDDPGSGGKRRRRSRSHDPEVEKTA